MTATVLVIAGSDSGGGAGIQADIKTITVLGGYAMTAVTAVTAQNTVGVLGIHMVPPDVIAAQIQVVADDIEPRAIKIGMLGNVETVKIVAATLLLLGLAAGPQRRRSALRSGGIHGGIPVVVDPVMIAKGGQSLLNDDAVTALTARLLPMATLITPNLPELERLTGQAVDTESTMAQAALTLARQHDCDVLAKGGHLPGNDLVDMLARPDGTIVRFPSKRIPSDDTHGTGCTMASAIATGLAAGMEIEAAIRLAQALVRDAITRAPGLGRGNGPLGLHRYRQ